MILVMKMSLMLNAIQKEKKRIDYMIASYLEQLETLPKGSVVAKTVRQNIYYYLKYRNGKKILTDYLGKDTERVDAVRAELEKRRHIERMIVRLQSERAIADKVLEEKR
jgi:hypothetical protein